MKAGKVSAAELNALTLERELEWFSRVLETALELYFEQNSEHDNVREIVPPELSRDRSEYARLVNRHAMDFDERLLLILAMIPHVRPQLLDLLFIRIEVSVKPADTRDSKYFRSPGIALDERHARPISDP